MGQFVRLAAFVTTCGTSSHLGLGAPSVGDQALGDQSKRVEEGSARCPSARLGKGRQAARADTFLELAHVAQELGRVPQQAQGGRPQQHGHQQEPPSAVDVGQAQHAEHLGPEGAPNWLT